ncbi:unnamed protein product [Orchesella dallaii]|uniref:Uncharacterized protein n=1 Tax=Orchesella dallaii TaxID=48710 RepID=A0ABP1PT14_9HEXA
MSFFGFLYVGESYRTGLRLPILLGRLHLGLLFSGVISSNGGGGRRSTLDRCTLRSFLFIATVLITKCGSSAFPNRTKQPSAEPVFTSTISYSPTTPAPSKHLDCDLHDQILSRQAKTNVIELHLHNRHHTSHTEESFGGQNGNVKTLGYFLRGLILPMLISLTCSFGFVIWKRRMKRARLEAIQNALEQARLQQPNESPSFVSPYSHPRHHHLPGGLVSNALLSVLDARGQWNLIPANYEGDDYMGEGGETARHKPYFHDQPPDYASVFDPPSYEEATTSTSSPSQLRQPWNSPLSPEYDSLLTIVASCSTHSPTNPWSSTNPFDFEEESTNGSDEGKHSMDSSSINATEQQ